MSYTTSSSSMSYLTVNEFNISLFIEASHELEYAKIAFKTNKCAIVQLLLNFWEKYGELMRTEHSLMTHYIHSMNEIMDLMEELKYIKRQKKVFCKCKHILYKDENFHHNIVKSIDELNMWRRFFSAPHKYDLLID